MSKEIKIGGHTFLRNEPTLKNIEDSIDLSGLNNSGRINQDDISTALSILLCGDDSYKVEISEFDKTEVLKEFCNILVDSLKGLSVSIGFVNAINSVAARDK